MVLTDDRYIGIPKTVARNKGKIGLLGMLIIGIIVIKVIGLID